MSIKRLISAMYALCATLSLPGCSTADPAMREAMSELDQRPESARVKLRPFAEQGNPVAIAQICIAYGRSMDSMVRSPEREQAFSWCQTAANAGSAESQYHLGNFYMWGLGTAEDRAEALRWYTESARQGNEHAEDAKRGMEGKPAVCKNWITGCRLM
ncbi:MAG: tetratricopeptide repeat protein [Casimicrobium sp.]|jgi:TPR repeat protein